MPTRNYSISYSVICTFIVFSCLTRMPKTDIAEGIVNEVYLVIFSNSNPLISAKHPHFVCYEKQKRFNAIIANDFAVASQFPISMRAAVETYSQMFRIRATRKTRCEVNKLTFYGAPMI